MLKAYDRLLEIGTDSAYQAALLAKTVKEVYTIAMVAPLPCGAESKLKELGYKNVMRHGDGYRGGEERPPFDAILINAAMPKIPRPLLDQLKVGGRMVLPQGKTGSSQELMVMIKQDDSLKEQFVKSLVFVPMTGEVWQ